MLGTDALTAVEEAAAAQLVREQRPGRYAFAHALIRETLYDELSLTRRVRTHAALAEAPGLTLAERAHHQLQADAPGAAESALAAAGEAMRSLAYEEAASFCERALEHSEGRLRAEVYLALGEAQLRAGEPARDAFREAAALAGEDPELFARAALGFSGLGVTIIAVDREAVALLEAALATDTSLRARLLARLAIETYYESTPERRKALGDEAVALAGPDEMLDALDARHTALWSAQYLEERLATANEMLALAIEHGDAEHELQARNWLVLDHFERGDLTAMRTEIDAHEALAERLRLPSYAWWAPMWRATLAILEGRFADAEAVIERLAADNDPNARLYAEIQTYMLHWNRGRFDLMNTVPIERESGRPAEYAYRAGYSWMLAMQGRGDEAREHIDWIARDGFARLGDDMNTLAALCELAQAIAGVAGPHACGGRARAAGALRRRNVQNARGAAGYGSAAHHVAVLEGCWAGRSGPLGPPGDRAFDGRGRWRRTSLGATSAERARSWIAADAETRALAERGSRTLGRAVDRAAIGHSRPGSTPTQSCSRHASDAAVRAPRRPRDRLARDSQSTIDSASSIRAIWYADGDQSSPTATSSSASPEPMPRNDRPGTCAPASSTPARSAPGDSALRSRSRRCRSGSSRSRRRTRRATATCARIRPSPTRS